MTYTHGKSKTKEYRAWFEMKRRCYDPKRQSYKNYGGRGIEVCDRWLHSFENFYEDMGDKPSDSYSLDRIDVNGNYTPENCRWEDRTTQNYNQRFLGNKSNNKNIKTNGYSYRAKVVRYGQERVSKSFTDINKAIEIRDEWLQEFQDDKEKWIKETKENMYRRE